VANEAKTHRRRLAGAVVSQYPSEKHLRYLAGLGFIAIGIWTLIKA
jgi:putative Ca2+/H+ antiporter (TMEM165/GDT1 family)